MAWRAVVVRFGWRVRIGRCVDAQEFVTTVITVLVPVIPIGKAPRYIGTAGIVPAMTTEIE